MKVRVSHFYTYEKCRGLLVSLLLVYSFELAQAMSGDVSMPRMVCAVVISFIAKFRTVAFVGRPHATARVLLGTHGAKPY